MLRYGPGLVFSFSCSRCGPAFLYAIAVLVAVFEWRERVVIRLPMGHRRVEIGIFACSFLLCELLVTGRRFPMFLRGSFLGSQLRFHPIETVKAGTASVYLLMP